jgi:hypothetical protein
MRKTDIQSGPDQSGTGTANKPLRVDLEAVVETIEEFGSASIELVAWELSLPTESVDGVWERAVERHLIEKVGDCPATGESMFALAA